MPSGMYPSSYPACTESMSVSDPSSEPEGKVATRSKTALNKKGSTTYALLLYLCSILK